MCHGIPNIAFHVFCCSKSALWFFGICRKRMISMHHIHHILHNDLHFSPRTCHANPAGTVILHMFRYTHLRFFTNFTLQALLKHNCCNVLMFLVQNWSEIVGLNQKRAYFFKHCTFLQNMCHGIPNITFHAFCCPESTLWFFVICWKRKSMHHILHNDLHFSHHTCHANPAGIILYMCFGTQICECEV